MGHLGAYVTGSRWRCHSIGRRGSSKDSTVTTQRSPAFQFYPKDWRDVKVRRMSLAAQGAYISIIADMWCDSKDQCSVLDNNAFLAKALGVEMTTWQELRREIQEPSEPLLQERDGRLYCKRLAETLARQQAHREEQARRGQRGGDAKAANRAAAMEAAAEVGATLQSNSESTEMVPFTPPSPTKTELMRLKAQAFWEAWPRNRRKVGKGAVVKWFVTHAPNDEKLELMVSKVASLAQSEDWAREQGRFIPLPLTWLHQGRWDDDVPEPVQSGYDALKEAFCNK